MQFADAERVNTERNALADITRQYGGTPEFGNQLYRAGLAKEGQAQEKYVLDRDASKAKLKTEQLTQQKSQIENGLKQFEAVGQIMTGVRDQASYDAAKQQMVQILGPEAVANMPPAYDPQIIEQGYLKAMSVKEQMELRHKELNNLILSDGSINQPLLAAKSQVARSGASSVQNYGQPTTAVDLATGEEKLLRFGNKGGTQVVAGYGPAKKPVSEAAAAKAEAANMTKQTQIASFDTMIGTLDRIGSHPGLARSVGMVGALPTMPGSDSANFQAELETFQSQAFIPMVSQLKGMGALSDAEGKKLTAAVGALNPKMGEKSFRESVSRIKADMQAAKARVSGQSGAKKPAPAKPAAIPGGWSVKEH
jgi:hypothetical protein